MRGRLWLVLGVLGGVAVGVGKAPYLAGAASSLADTALRSVNTGGLTLVRDAASHGVPRRVVEGIAAVIAVLIPGIAALLLVVAARVTLGLRALVALLLAALGVASFAYFPTGHAIGVTFLALTIAGILVVASGPLVVAPLAGVAALIGTEFLPKLVEGHTALPTVPVNELHEALFASVGTPAWLQILLLVLAALPFAAAARLVLR